MFVINDMELLARLGKYKILTSILSKSSISISAIRLNEYSFMLKKQIQIYSGLKLCYPNDEFDSWVKGKRANASIGDLSSLHLAQSQDLGIVLSNEDSHLQQIAARAKILFVDFDEFIRKTVKDPHMINMYDMIKAA